MRTAIALSGGVDSSVAAALVAQRKVPAFGVTMRLFGDVVVQAGRNGRCCGGEDTEIAREAAAQLGLPFYVLDFADDFRRTVIEPFVTAYREGRTPVPCADCNQFIKFDRLLARCRGLGAERLATGHYARLGRDGHGRHGDGVAPHVLRQVHAGQQAFALEPSFAQAV